MATEDGLTDDKSPGNLTCAYLVPIGQKNIPEKSYLKFTWDSYLNSQQGGGSTTALLFRQKIFSKIAMH